MCFFKKKENDYVEIKEKLKKLFEIKPNSTNFGDESGNGEYVGLYQERIFDKTQLGFRVDANRYKVKQWIGNQFYIVGGYGQLGDVLVVDGSNETLPIYSLEHDNWKKMEKISNSVEDFSKIIELINKTNIKDNKQCKELKENISKIIKCEFWNNEIDIAYRQNQ